MSIINTQFEDEHITDVPDLDDEYYYSLGFSSCKGFTKLMKLVLLTKKHPELVQQLDVYLKLYPEEVNKQNEQGYTPLMIACLNSKNASSVETVQMLLNTKDIDLDIKNNAGFTALMVTEIYGQEQIVAILKGTVDEDLVSKVEKLEAKVKKLESSMKNAVDALTV